MYSTALEYFMSIWPCVIVIRDTFVLTRLGVSVTLVGMTAAAMLSNAWLACSELRYVQKMVCRAWGDSR